MLHLMQAVRAVASVVDSQTLDGYRFAELLEKLRV